jgi:hypothetical protein
MDIQLHDSVQARFDELRHQARAKWELYERLEYVSFVLGVALAFVTAVSMAAASTLAPHTMSTLFTPSMFTFVSTVTSAFAAGIVTIRERFKWGELAHSWRRLHAKLVYHGALYAQRQPPYADAENEPRGMGRTRFIGKMESLQLSMDSGGVGSKKRADEPGKRSPEVTPSEWEPQG